MDSLESVVSDLLDLFPFAIAEYYSKLEFDFYFAPASCTYTLDVESYASSFVFSSDGLYEMAYTCRAESAFFESQTFSSLWDRLIACVVENKWNFEFDESFDDRIFTVYGEEALATISKIVTTLLEHRNLGAFL